MDFAAFSELDWNESGEWSLPIKMLAIVLLAAFVLGMSYWFIVKGQQAELLALEQKEIQLKQIFEAKQNKASNLDSYKMQMQEIETSLAIMLEQLPRKNEVADLLIDISRTGLANGLQFQLFKPDQEQPVDFYTELPIAMEIIGSYHQLAEFASEVAGLPRIVSLHNFTMTPLKPGSEEIKMTVTAKTYRYLDSEGNDSNDPE